MIDITLQIHHDMRTYKNKIEKIPQIINVSNDLVYESDLHINLHTGTHVDYPLHMIPGGKTSDDYDISCFTGKCYVLDATYMNHRVLKKDLQSINIKGYDFILFKTKNSFNTTFNPDYIYVSEEAAEYLSTFKLKGVGIDALGIERDQPDHPTHKLLLQKDILIFEGLDLKDVSEGVYEFIGLPTKIKGVEAAPVRAILR